MTDDIFKLFSLLVSNDVVDDAASAGPDHVSTESMEVECVTRAVDGTNKESTTSLRTYFFFAFGFLEP